MSNSLAAVHPELIAEWSEKNLPLTPDSITFGSNKKVWWKGACGHEWETSVKARSNGEKCPICSGARVVAGINDLSTLKPELASEWSEENEIKPTEVSIGSHKKVIWKCKLGHEWIATVKSRTINKTFGSGALTGFLRRCLLKKSRNEVWRVCGKMGWRQIISLHMRRLPWCQIIFQLGDLRQMN